MPRKKIKFKRKHRIFSKEQRIKIVQEIESNQLSRAEAMEKYNIVNTSTLQSWILRYGSGEGAAKTRPIGKIEKRQAAYKVIAGEATVHDIAREMNVGLHTVWSWIRTAKDDISLGKPIKKVDATALAANQQQVEDLRLKITVLETMIDLAEKELNIDIRKKSGTKQ